MKENCHPNRIMLHGNLLKRRHKSSHDRIADQKHKSAHNEELYNDLLNLLFQKDREISKLDRRIQSLQIELEQRKQDYATSLLALRAKYDSKQEKWGLKLLEAQKLLHSYRVKAEEMQNLFQSDLASQNDYIEVSDSLSQDIVRTLAEREEAHISEYNYLVKKLDEVLYIQNAPTSPVIKRQVESHDTAKTQKQFEEITERSQDPSLYEGESKIPSEPQIIEQFVSYTDQIKPCDGDQGSPPYAGTQGQENSPQVKTLKLEESPRYEIATERTEDHREIRNSSPALARKKSTRFMHYNTLRNNDILFTQQHIKDAIRSKQNLREKRLSFVDQKMALKLVQRAKKSELRASVTNIQPLRTTRTEDYQTTRASSVFSPKIFSSRKGLDNVRESIATMPRDISQVNVWQMMKIASIRAQIQAIIHNLNEQVSIFKRKPSVLIKTPRPLYLYRVLQCPSRFTENEYQKEDSCRSFVLSPTKKKNDEESKTQRRFSKIQEDQKQKKMRISANLLNSYRMQDQNNGDFLKLQISAILRDSSLSLTEKEMFVFSILNASLIKEDKQNGPLCNSEYLIRTPNQSLQLKSPLSNHYTFSFKDSEHKGFFERLMAHHSLDSKGVFTIPENQKDFTTFSLNSFNSSFRVKTEVSRNESSLDEENILIHSFNNKQNGAPKTVFDSIAEQILETEREQLKPETEQPDLQLKQTEEEQIQSSDRAILESKFYNNDTSPLYQNNGLDSVAQMIGNDPILERLDVPSDREHRESSSPLEFVSQPALNSEQRLRSTSSTRSPEIMVTKEAYISKIPTIESLESESNYQDDEVYYIQEDEDQQSKEKENNEDRVETNKSTKNQEASFNFTFTPSDNNTCGCARSNPAISTNSVFGRNFDASSRNSCITANDRISKDRHPEVHINLQELATYGRLEFEPEE